MNTPMNLDVSKYSIDELEEILRLRKPYTYEDVAIRIDDYSEKLGYTKEGDGIATFLSDVSNTFKRLLDSHNKTVATTHPVMHPAVYNPSSSHVTRRIINVDSRYRKDPFDTAATNFRFELAESLTNVKSLRLYAVHIPTTWYAFSPKYGNTRFFVGAPGGTPVAYDIPGGNYSPAELTAEFSAKTQSIDNNLAATWDSNTFKNTINHTHNGGSAHEITFYSETDAVYDFSTGCEVRTKINGSLGWAMGYRGAAATVQTTLTGIDSIEFPATTDTFGPKYFYLVLDDFTNSQLSRGVVGLTGTDTNGIDTWKNDRLRPPTNTNVLAMISVEKLKTDERGIMPFISSGLEFNVRNYSSPVDIARMEVRLVDDRGYTVDLNGADWSFAMLAEQQL
jgi:hypothetical protein